MFSTQSVIVTTNIFLLNHTVCNQPLIRINETNVPWFDFKEPAGVLSLGRISFIHHLYPKHVFSILEDPEKSASLFALLYLFLASNFAFLRGFPVKSSLCMKHISERQNQPLKSHGLGRSHMLYGSSGENNLRCLLELAKWVQLLPAAGPARQCGDREEVQSQR